MHACKLSPLACMRASLRTMRSMDTPPGTAATRFGALVTRLATRASYDVTPGAGGRAALARAVGMSPAAVGRMLDGKTLPMPNQFEAIAKVLGTDVRDLLVEAEVISRSAWPNDGGSHVRSATERSQPPSPEAALDAWGLTDPMIRRMLHSQINEAIRLQQEADRDTASTGGP